MTTTKPDTTVVAVFGFLLVMSASLFAAAEPGTGAADEPADGDRGFRAATSGAPDGEQEFAPEGVPLYDERVVPDYDGRGEEPTTTGDVLIWVPRVILFPAFVVTEYAVRWPLGVATRAVEKYHVLEWIDHYTSWDDDQAGVYPRLRLERGFSFAVGFTLLWKNLALDGNDYAVGADFNFDRNVTFDALTSHRMLEDTLVVEGRFSIEQRDDFVFYGVGLDTPQADESRFFRKKTMGIVSSELKPIPPGFSSLLSLEISDNDFDCSFDDRRDICGGDGEPNTADDRLPIDDRDGASFFTSGYHLVRAKSRVSWDSRPERPEPGTGMRVDLLGRWARGFGEVSEDVHFVGYGGELSFFLDVHHQRTIGLRLYSEFTQPIDGGRIPFAELITTGGVERMRGFLHARFHGRSVAVGTIDYRYPIWSFLDANLFFEVGNGFGPHLEDFQPEKLRSSAGFGLRTNQSRHFSWDLVIALGTTQFENPDFGVDHARISFGTNLGF